MNKRIKKKRLKQYHRDMARALAIYQAFFAPIPVIWDLISQARTDV